MLAAVVAVLPFVASGPANAATTAGTFKVKDTTPGVAVPGTFVGFSIDPAELCSVVALAASDPAFDQLFVTMGPGTLRVGGNTGDTFASWSTTATASCVWDNLVMTPTLVQQFIAFAQSVGYQVDWQVPLNNGQLDEDASEAAFVASQPDVSTIEIGDEPNFYRTSLQAPAAYEAAWATVYSDYQADGGTLPVTGPSLGMPYSTNLTDFLQTDGGDISAVTGHYYTPSNAKTNPGSCTGLLDLSTLAPELTQRVSQSASYGLPFQVNETNSFYNQGIPGISNAYCSALWAAEYTSMAMSEGVASVYFHGTDNAPVGNTNGLAQYYTPINQDGTPAPEYYGMLFAAQLSAGGAQVLPVTTTTAVAGVSVYAVLTSSGQVRLALFNTGTAAKTISVTTTGLYKTPTELTLNASGLKATAGVKLGGSSIAADGTWTPTSQTATGVTITKHVIKVKVLAHSGNIVTLNPVS